jgi:hypothetical protein
MSYNINNCYGLSSEEITSMYGYIKQWRIILYSCKPIDPSRSIAAIEKAYSALELSRPSIVLQQGFNKAKDWIEKHCFQPLGCDDYHQLYMNLVDLTFDRSSSETLIQHTTSITLLLGKEIFIFHGIYQTAYQVLDNVIEHWVSRLINIEIEHINNAYNQYRIEKYHVKHDRKAWNIIKYLTQECPFLISLSGTCLIVERPILVYLDNELLPHAQNQAAIKFGDNFVIYCYHGIPFPDKYGEIPINDWKPEWILLENTDKYKSILIYTIGYQRFYYEYPDYDFWQEYDRLLMESLDIIINWQLYHYNQLYLKQPQDDPLTIKPNATKQITEGLPFQLPQELYEFYHYYNSGYQLIPGLQFYPLQQAIQALAQLTWIHSDTGYPFPLFRGDKGEIYYVLADDPQTTYSHVYRIFPGEEPMVYAECVTSLIVTIAQCYQEGAYYIAIDEETGERSIEQDLDKIEPTFEKFNPDQIETWRKIWKS